MSTQDPPDSTEPKVVDLERVRAIRSFKEDESIAYVELLWGSRSFAVHAAIRDLDAMRNGTEPEDKPLREPETMFEMEVLIRRIRWTANYLALTWGADQMIVPEDWDGDVREPPPDLGSPE